MRKMVCSFCGYVIHFWEEFDSLYGKFYHRQIVSDAGVRCKRVKKVPCSLEEAEAKYTKEE